MTYFSAVLRVASVAALVLSLGCSTKPVNQTGRHGRWRHRRREPGSAGRA